jgi:hypothetical protein
MMEQIRRDQKLCKPLVGGSSPSPGTNEIMSGPETWVTERT